MQNPSIYKQILRQMKAAPDAVAVESDGTQYSYRALEEMVDSTAAQLTDSGIGESSLLVVHMSRGANLIASILAAWRVGAAYTCLDRGLPVERATQALTKIGARNILTDNNGGVEWAGKDFVVQVIDNLELLPAPVGHYKEPNPEDIAYIVFTSGTTGVPKPVAIPHRAVTAHAYAVTREYGLTAEDAVLQFANPAFDVMVEEVFPTLAAGGTVIVTPEPTPTPRELETLIRTTGVTVANLPTPYWSTWVGDLDAEPRKVPASLRLMVVGSDVGYRTTLLRWREHSGVTVINAYGLSETTVTVVTAKFDETDPVENDLLPIGKPLPNVEIQILDAEMQPVSDGVGELYVGGSQVALGYYNSPSETNERFIKNPTPSNGDRILYRTGDLVRRASTGDLYMLGRVDSQAKIRGHRVEPLAVQTALRETPFITDAYVTIGGQESSRTLVAHVVTRPGHPRPNVAEIRNHLESKLAPYAIPSQFYFHDHLPVLPNGKVNTRALADDAEAERIQENPALGQSSGMTADSISRLRAIWSEVLGLPAEQIGPSQNFFDIGGHSLLLVRVQQLIAQEFGLQLPGVALFESPTLITLASKVDGNEPSDELVTSEPRRRRGNLAKNLEARRRVRPQ